MVVPGSLTRARARVGLAALVVVAVLLWWWWPGLAGDADDIDVRIAIGGELAVANQSIDRRVREEGFRLERTSAPADWCEAAELIGRAPRDGSRVLVWASSGDGCSIDDAVRDLVDAAAGRRLVVVHLPTDAEAIRESFESRGVRVVEAERLLGDPGSSHDCLWWEDCPESGAIEPWDDGALGPIGGERLARMIVTEIL